MKIARSARVAPWLILLLALGLRPALAVVIDSGDGSGNTTAPADDPGWDRIGVLGHTTGCYLGNHWVLTAGHIGNRELRLGDRRFHGVQGKIRRRLATSALLEADLQLFQLREAPELPPLRLASSAPRVRTPVVMVGNGLQRGPSQTAWSRLWTIVPRRDAWYSGYPTGPERALRWGTNHIASAGELARTGELVTRVFSTRFDGGLPSPHEAQAVSGDSGGPVFAKNSDGEWELVGIMITVSMEPDQPRDHAIYGNVTYVADIHAYREQIEKIVASSPDQDRDGLLDIDDNCTRVKNPDQADADGDGTGDLCEEPEEGKDPGSRPTDR